MKKPIYIIGAGGHCHSIIDVVESGSEYEIIGIIDNEMKEDVLGYSVVGRDQDIPNLLSRCDNFIIAVGQITSSTIRVKLFNYVKSIGGRFPVICSSTSRIARTAKIGEGTIIMHYCLINSNCSLGVNNIINSGCLIEHDAIIGDHNHISTKATINGNCQIDNNNFIGSGSTVIQGKKINSGCIIGAGSLVNSNLEKEGVYYGSPVRLREK